MRLVKLCLRKLFATAPTSRVNQFTIPVSELSEKTRYGVRS